MSNKMAEDGNTTEFTGMTGAGREDYMHVVGFAVLDRLPVLHRRFGGRVLAVQRRDYTGALVVDSDLSLEVLRGRVLQNYGDLSRQEIVLGTVKEIARGHRSFSN